MLSSNRIGCRNVGVLAEADRVVLRTGLGVDFRFQRAKTQYPNLVDAVNRLLVPNMTDKTAAFNKEQFRIGIWKIVNTSLDQRGIALQASWGS